MADKKRGYVPIYRSIQDNWIWMNDEPFSKGQAWVDLLLSVNHEEKKILVNGNVKYIKPGQRWTSLRVLADRWQWSKDRVKRFLNLLISEQMIHIDKTPNGTLLTVINWDNFNNYNHDLCDTNKDTDKDTHKDTDETQTGRNNNDNNENNVNNEKEDIPAPPVALPSGGGEWQ